MLIYAILALGLNVLVGYAGLVTLGHAGLFGIAAYAGAILINDGHGHVVVAIGALLATLAATAMFAVLALRGTGLGFVMITVALGQIVWGIAYRWISLTNGDNGISISARPAPFGLSLADAAGVLLGDASSCSWSPSPRWRSSSPRRSARPARHARPAAAHDRARLQCLADALPRLPVLRLLERRRGAAVSLLQPVRQPAGGRAQRIGRGAADGDRRRHRDAARADRRRGAGHHHEVRRQRLHRALELRARRDLRGDRRLHAGGAGARLGAAVALGDRRCCGRRAGAGAPPREPDDDRARGARSATSRSAACASPPR